MGILIVSPAVKSASSRDGETSPKHGIRRECLDYVIPLNESHLRRTLPEWMCRYNIGRPNQSLGPGIPEQVHHPTTPCEPTDQPSQTSLVIGKLILGGLHHEYR
jgi:putative transposase